MLIESVHEWSASGLCFGLDRLDFFDNYEDSVDSGNYELAINVDDRCKRCPVQSKCLAFAVTHKEWGVWGGVYFEGGKISKQYNKHKTNSDWFDVWSHATMDI